MSRGGSRIWDNIMGGRGCTGNHADQYMSDCEAATTITECSAKKNCRVLYEVGIRSALVNISQLYSPEIITADLIRLSLA